MATITTNVRYMKVNDHVISFLIAHAENLLEEWNSTENQVEFLKNVIPKNTARAQLQEEKRKLKAEEKKKKDEIAAENKKNKKKGHKSAFIYFCMDMRPKLSDEVSSKDMLAELGKRWKLIKETEGADQYKKMADEEKQERSQEMTVSKAEAKAISRKKAAEIAKQAKLPYKKFAAANQPGVKAANKKMRVADITQVLKNMWDELSPEDKEYWETA